MITQLLAALVTPQELPIPQTPITAGPTSTVRTVLQIVFGFAGGISLVIIARAAFRLTISQGEPQKIAKERDAIIYAIIGLVISILAFSIVSFFLERVK